MNNLLVGFDPTELIDFINFLSQLVHRLQVCSISRSSMSVVFTTASYSQEKLFDVLNQLIGPLVAHTNGVLSQAVTGTDDQVTNMDTKRAYLTLLNSIMSSKLQGIFTSERRSASRPCLERLSTLASQRTKLS